MLTTKSYACTDELILQARNFLAKENISSVLKSNPYEKMVPYNLWFNHESYVVDNSVENNQNLRIRFFKGIALTPIVSYDANFLSKIKQLIPNMTLYQPFYPERFYSVWEFLQHEYLSDCKNCLFIGQEQNLGSIESLILYHERYQHSYANNKYHVWLTGQETYNYYDKSYSLSSPNVNYLAQSYNLEFLASSLGLQQYDFIIIDAISMFDNILNWNNEEHDLQATLFYLLTILTKLKTSSSVLIRMTTIGQHSWNYIFDICYRYFKEYTFIRPKTSNPYNPEIYLFLNKFIGNRSDLVLDQFLKTFYRNKIYELFNLNIDCNPNNPILKKYIENRNVWRNNLLQNLEGKSVIDTDICYISKWHNKYNLKQIKDIRYSDYIISNRHDYLFSIENNSELTLRCVVPSILLDNTSYNRLLNKKAVLNHCKRIMDTKPSRMFMDPNKMHDFSNEYYITWDAITNQLDYYKYIKNKIKKYYGGQMVTNAWIKLYEILNTFPEILDSNKTIKSFHLCEAPGAFVSAIHHYLTIKNQNLDWYAQTLNPAYNQKEALQDHYGLMSEYPEKWLFGDKSNNTGDITCSAIIKYYANHPDLQNIDFMTGDAGIICNPNCINEQETQLVKINMGQIVCILACLSVGKSAVFKTFLPMSEPLTISLMNLLSVLFQTVTIHKPNASGGSNSEVYIILEFYKGISNSMLEMLYVMLDDPKITSKSFITDKLDRNFFKEYIDSISKLIDRQIEFLMRNYYFYYNSDKLHEVESKKTEFTDMWFIENYVTYLNKPLLNNIML